jgi:titin
VVPLEDRLLPSVFWVTNTNNDGPGSLHQAIEDANANPGTDRIWFDIEPGGPRTISLTSPLPTILDPVIIDGTSQAGWVANPIITVAPASSVPMAPDPPAFDSNGLTITADGCTVKGLVLQGFGEAGIGVYSNNNLIAGDWIENNGVVDTTVGAGIDIANVVSGNTIGGTTARTRNVISGNSGDGVYIHESSTANLVEGNYIGTNQTGTTALPNGTGVDIADGANNNTVGGTAARAGNLISANHHDGISIESGVTGVLVQGNKIGTDVTGTTALANGSNGVEISSSGNMVGGTAAGAGNLISGNGFEGISILGDANQVQGDMIGTNAAGTAALANDANGVEIFFSSNNTVGGTAAGAGNLISGNISDGIRIFGGDGNLVQGNKVGTNADGTAALANDANGVEVAASGNTVGGTVAGAGNLISGNAEDGIVFDSGATANVVQGNKIGTNAAGTAAVPNGVDGVDLFGAPGSTVGGTAAGAGNLISGNSQDGILIDSGATGILVQGNKIGTDVTGTTAVANGYNGVEIMSSGNTVGGAAVGAGNLISGNGLGGIVIESPATANQVQGNKIGTNAAGTAAVANQDGGVDIIAASNNTVGGTAAGAGNLISGNGFDGIFIDSGATANLVQGNKIGTNADGTAALANDGEGIHIVIDSSFNTVGGTAAGAGNLIAGNTFDGILIDGNRTLVQGNTIGTNAAGSAAVANGFSGVFIRGDNETIGGTAAGAGNLISGNSQDGILLSGVHNVLQGNKIGTNAAGTAAVANGQSGVDFVFSSNNTVGGTAAGAGNLISGNSQDGILIESGATGVVMQGNKIGTNVGGTAAVANGQSGVEIMSSGITIGGTAAGAGNLISGNTQDGILIEATFFSSPTANLVQGNKIGTDAAGGKAVANHGSGVHIVAASNNTIGGTTAGAANTIAFNQADGVFVESGTGNGIRQNSIFRNGGLGIRLGSGANNNQPAPTLTSAMYNPGTQVLTVHGTMTGSPGSQVTLEFFANPAGDPEGKVFLGSLVVTIGPGGKVSFTFTVHTTAVSPGMLLTATATDATDDTSQFSAGRMVM